jgi:hypothetical protein
MILENDGIEEEEKTPLQLSNGKFTSTASLAKEKFSDRS